MKNLREAQLSPRHLDLLRRRGGGNSEARIENRVLVFIRGHDYFLL